jgi:hypothetical protein
MDRDYYASLQEKRKIIGLHLYLLSSGPFKGRFLALRAMERKMRESLALAFIGASFRRL